jgi:hypothetical protein
VTAKERRSRCGDVLLDVTDIRKKSVGIYLNSFANNCALVLQSRYCIQFNFYNEGTEIEDLSLCRFSPLYTKKKGSKVTIKIREWDISHMQCFQQLEPSACLLD